MQKILRLQSIALVVIFCLCIYGLILIFNDIEKEAQKIEWAGASEQAEAFFVPSRPGTDYSAWEQKIKSAQTDEGKRHTAERATRVSRGGSFVAIATAYCSCEKCCGKSDGITASGKKAHWGTVAAPEWLPFGTKLRIEGFSTVFTVEDRGGAIKGNRIDIFFTSHKEALEFGKRKVRVYVIGGDENVMD